MPRELPLRPVIDEPPPFLGKWKRVYTAVLLYLVCLILVLFAITRFFHYPAQ